MMNYWGTRKIFADKNGGRSRKTPLPLQAKGYSKFPINYCSF